MIAERLSAAENVATDSRSTSRALFLSGMIASAIAVLVYLLLFWNRFAGLRSGSGDYFGALAILHGILPYRDVFAPTPPFTAFRAALVLLLFGKGYIVSRAFGVFERILLTILVYCWLARLFRASTAAMAAIVTLIICSGDLSDPIASYNHEAIIWAVATGLLASFSLDEKHFQTPKSLLLSALLTGFAAGGTCTTKQTIGLATTVLVLGVVCACLFRLNGWRSAVRFGVGFCAGWVVAVAILIVWLWSAGLLHAFLIDLFFKGPAAKASHASDFVYRALVVSQGQYRPAILGVIGAICAAAAWWVSRHPKARRSDSLSRVASVLVLAILVIAAAAGLSYAGYGGSRLLLSASIYFTVFCITAICIFYFVMWISGRLNRRQAQFWLYAAVAFGIAITLSLSWPVFEAMVVPGLGLPIAFCLDTLGKPLQMALYAVCALLIFSGTSAKLKVPFGFDGFDEPPVRTADTRSALPQMRGFLLPAPVVRFVDGTVDIVKKNSTSTDTIFTYPEFALFYALSDRACPTASCSHNIDVVNDAMSREEAQRLLKSRPAVLIYYRVPEAALKSDEILWRRGKRSGQRDLIDAMETLAKQYRLAGTFPVPPNPVPVQVYVRQ